MSGVESRENDKLFSDVDDEFDDAQDSLPEDAVLDTGDTADLDKSSGASCNGKGRGRGNGEKEKSTGHVKLSIGLSGC